MDGPFFALDLSTGSSDDAERTRRWSSSRPIKPSVNLGPTSSKQDLGVIRSGYSPSEHTARKHEEDADYYVVPELCGPKLWRIIIDSGCEDYGSDGILDKRDTEDSPDVRQEEGSEEDPHSGGGGGGEVRKESCE